MKRVLIITYYWPPSGGGGVMRWLKMSKYLPEFGWQPVIYTPENPDPSVIDESLVKEVSPEAEILRTPIWEPYSWYRKFTGKNKTEKFKAGYIAEASRGSWKDKLSVFIRGNLLIPDPRVFWVNPSVKFLRKYLTKNQVDLIVTTGPPHSMHLIGLKLKKYYNIPWLADFRDPWTEIDFYHRLNLTRLADQCHHNLEKKVLTSADFVTVVSPDIKRTTELLAGRTVRVIYNGYDPADFEFEKGSSPNEKFTISHFGAFNRDRNPAILWKTLGEICRINPTFAQFLKIQLIGQTDDTILHAIENEGLSKCLKVNGHMDHREGLKFIASSQILLLPLNNAPNVLGILPGKMYEYMALQKPILAIGPPEGDFASIILATKTGFVHGFDDGQGLKLTIEKLFDSFLKGEPVIESGDFEKFSRRNLAKEIISFAGGLKTDDNRL